MPDQNLLPPATQVKSQSKIITLLGLVICICLIAVGLNIQQELIQSGNRIGADMFLKENQIFISRIIPGGPSFQAGIKANSYIVTVNDNPIQNFVQFDQALSTEDPEVTLVVFKNGRSSSHKLYKGMPPQLRDFLVEILICSLFLLLAYISIPAQGKRNTTRNLLLILLFLSLGLEYILIPVRDLLNTTAGLSYWMVVTGILLAAITGGLTFALELHILCITPKPRPWFTRNKTVILASFYSISVYFIITLAFFYFDYSPPGIQGTLFSFMAWSLINILWVSLILAILLIQFTATESSREKSLLIIICASMLPFVITISLIEWAFLSETTEPEWLNSLEIFARICFPVGFMIAVKRYDLADIGHNIQRPVVFKFVSALIIFYLLDSLYSYFLKLENFDSTFTLYFAIGSLFIGMLWLPLSRLLNHWASSPGYNDL